MTCPTMCDDDCDLPCHEVHLPYHKREHDPDQCALGFQAPPKPRPVIPPPNPLLAVTADDSPARPLA